MSGRLLLFGAIGALAALPSSLQAQQRQVQLGLTVGYGLPANFFQPHVIQRQFALTGAEDPSLHLAALTEVRWGRRPVGLRVEGFYNRLTSHPFILATPPLPPDVARSALRDEVYGLTVNAVYERYSRERIEPYFIAGVGVYHTRLGTNPDVGRSEITEVYAGTGVGYNLGTGISIRIGQTKLRLESRLHRATNQVRGTPFIPTSVSFVVPLRMLSGG